MTKIVFITSGKIDYLLPGRDLYDSISSTACGEQFPSLSTDGIAGVSIKINELRDLDPSIIYSAPSAQCLETSQIINEQLSIPLKQSHKLLPLRFNLKDIISKEDFDLKEGLRFELIRNGFIKLFFEDRLIDSNKKIENRYNDFILETIVKNNKDKTVIAVSHAYLIKLFYIYSVIKGLIYEDKATLTKMFNPKKEPMGRLETLVLEF